MTAVHLLAFASLGCAAGFLGAVLGIGGGVFLIPAMVLWLDVPVTQAVAAGLVTVVATSNAAASVNVERGVANMRLGMVLELATVAGALLGACLAHRVAPGLVIGLFAALIAVMAVKLWQGNPPGPEASAEAGAAPGALDAEYFDPALGRRVAYRVRRLGWGMAVSLAAGALSGLLGVGGGVFKVPALHLLCAVPMKAAAATSNFMIGVTAASSAFIYIGRGAVPPDLTSACVLGVFAGSAAGVRLSQRLADRTMRRGFAVLLVYLSIHMALRAARG